ncbi:hypothetical protein COCSUDRAFT_64098 [Coccomyxa subellipsoidea C-169]|uniref:Uncharacterized protein n=1 Tax=Coccomyxa subellipsoidea (strain C-169) TaxID=574566 RepID=I0Z945_COCSC|nr:hypothetical protein COCSUDRAFT_64098 [Coccomyxa subellipsoidea C-169]EIE27164.1 hypothetical protein COCSUDRAFT_64098 [Coccomyxa subellipsoidea C-169]|eukprot:XP_005651708.1 hypothetical protein COCSUDRAFT_64098 [Coccomyxa subellipsoidea C-169]
MIPILLILGAGAALEIKRLASRSHGDENTQALREREKQLKDILQALRKELDKEKVEHAAEIVKNEVLQQQAGELSEQKEELELQGEALRRENDALRSRAEALAQSAESLLAEKGGIQHQLENLKIESKKEAEKAAEAEAELRRDIAETLERFTAGEIDADGFLDDLRDMGIDVECTVDQLTLTSRQTESTSSAPGWSESMRLVCGSSEQMAQLISAGSLRNDAHLDRSASVLRSIQNTPRESTLTPRFSLPSNLATLTPRLFNKDPSVAEPAALPPLRQPEKEPEDKAGTPPNSYTVEANSLVFTKPAKAPPCQKPPMVPRLGLNVALGSSAPPSSEKAALASLAFPSDDEAALGRPSLDIVAAGP